MFIPQCTIVVNPAKRVLELKGTESGRPFASRKIFELSASDPNEFERWIQAITPISVQQQGDATYNPILAGQASFDNASLHSKVQADEENGLNQPGIVNLGQANAASSGAAAGENGATHETKDQLNKAEKNKTELNGNYYADDDEVKKLTVEYCTHTPIGTSADSIAPYTTTTENNNNYNKATAMNEDNVMTTKNKAVTSPVDVNNCIPGIGPTREGSDIFWDPQ